MRVCSSEAGFGPLRSILKRSLRLLQGSASRFPIEGGDTIYVSEAPLTQWNRFMGTVLPFGQAAKMGASAATGVPVP